ncbi:receptor-like protein 35 [Quercus suber]|uniref:Receptor-like protein 35 n=1 Tax=Quercus suber TaxID=58331 RepID=A0AAW0JJW3_QUESU
MRLDDTGLQRLIRNQTKLSELFLVEVDVFSFRSMGLSEIGFLIDLPSLMSNLKSLRELYLNGCNFVGSYPTFLSNLTKITSLDLSHNNFSGQIPWSLLKFERLTLLDILFNNFVGQLSDVTTYLAKLSSSNNYSNSQLDSLISSKLAFLHNLLNGMIPFWLYSISHLHYLYMDNNKFTRGILT